MPDFWKNGEEAGAAEKEGASGGGVGREVIKVTPSLL